jgi:hypothetical protein
MVVALLSLSKGTVDSVILRVHCCYTVVTLLLHCCYTVVTLLLHCCYTVVTLLLHCCYTVVTLSLLHCYTVVPLLSLSKGTVDSAVPRELRADEMPRLCADFVHAGTSTTVNKCS